MATANSQCRMAHVRYMVSRTLKWRLTGFLRQEGFNRALQNHGEQRERNSSGRRDHEDLHEARLGSWFTGSSPALTSSLLPLSIEFCIARVAESRNSGQLRPGFFSGLGGRGEVG